MCGICGYFSNKKITTEQLQKMNDTMYHRGPDDSGFWEGMTENGKFIGLAQRRLSIQDLSPLGHQPMFSNDENIVIVYNGEIYNYPELKKSLEKLGYHFKSHCDTEAIIAAYQEWGTECFSKLNGMFAIAIYDMKEETLILARDRIGKKPLYYYCKDQVFAFGSELKPIMMYPEFEKKIQKKMIGKFLCNKYLEAPYSIFENTYKMIPGTYIVYKAGKLENYVFWDILQRKENLQKKDTDISYAETVKELEKKIYSAVQSRLISDVPLGTFLSGGIDSTLVTAMTQKAVGSPVKSFSIGFYDKERDEAPYAAEIAKHIGTLHQELYVGEKEIISMLDRLPYYYDEPLSDSSQLPTMLVSKMAAEEVTVALSGDGGDELFCGYKMYDWTRTAQNVDKLADVVSMIPGAGAIKKVLPPEVRALLNNRDEAYKTQLFIDVMQEEAARLLGQNTVEAKFAFEKYLQFPDWQERRMLLDMRTYLPDEVLAKMDRASMKYSLEVRCPILDHQVIEQSFTIPQRYKYYRGDKKHILKDVAYRYVPENLLNRPKKGFGVPLKKWLRTILSEKIKRYADPVLLKKQDIFVPDAVERLISLQKRSDKIMYSSMLWSFYIFQMWYQTYIEDLWS